MGKGLALQVKKALPENFATYEKACKAGEVAPGRMHIVQRLASPRFIINFPTKKHWRHPSKIEYVRDGLRDLVQQVQRLGIKSIAIPPLGCGNGGLSWADVKPLIVCAFEGAGDVRVVLFEPSDAPTADKIIEGESEARVSSTPLRSVRGHASQGAAWKRLHDQGWVLMTLRVAS